MKSGIPKNKNGKAYKRYLKRLKDIDSTLAKGALPPFWAETTKYKNTSIMPGGLPSLGKRR